MTNGVIARNNVVFGQNGQRGAGVYTEGDVSLFNCLVYNNVCRGSQNNVLGDGLCAYNGAASLALDFCTVAFNGTCGLYRHNGAVSASDSILWGNGDDVNGTVTLTRCNVADGDSNGVNGNISAEPKFVFGFRLDAASPCLDQSALTAAEAGLASRTTLASGATDSGFADLGWHAPAAAVDARAPAEGVGGARVGPQLVVADGAGVDHGAAAREGADRATVGRHELQDRAVGGSGERRAGERDAGGVGHARDRGVGAARVEDRQFGARAGDRDVESLVEDPGEDLAAGGVEGAFAHVDRRAGRGQRQRLRHGREGRAGGAVARGVGAGGGDMQVGGGGVDGAVTAIDSIFHANGGDFGGTPSLTYCNTQDGLQIGVNGNISVDPLFDRGYYLDASSLCRDAGSAPAEASAVAGLTTSADGAADGGTVDMGFHHMTGLASDYAAIYVSGVGSDANDGKTVGAPFRTLTKALSVAEDGSAIHVAAGLYDAAAGETFPLVANGIAGLCLVGDGPAQVLVDAGGGDGALALQNCPNAVVQGMSFKNAIRTTSNGTDAHAYGGGLALLFSGGVVVENCAFENNKVSSASKGAYGGGAGLFASTATIRGCRFIGNDVASNSGTAYAYGGVAMAKQTVANLLRIPIHYYALVNWQGFIEVMDIIGGGKHFCGFQSASNSASDYGDCHARAVTEQYVSICNKI